MLFAENFFSLNLCQSWFTVFKELQSEGITPVEADNEYLIEKIERIRQWKQYIQDKIVRIIQKESQKVMLHCRKFVFNIFNIFRKNTRNWKPTQL